MISEKPVVSIIVPNYNHGQFLSKRIESILAQTYQNFELIILDDCSIDNSRAVIENYRDHPKVKYIVYNEENGGSPFAQWAKGISLSTGKYIWIAESDDWCEDRLLERLIAPLDADDNCHVSYCQSYCVEEDGTIRWQSSHHKLEEIVDGKQFIKKYMLLGNAVFNASMVVWRKQLYSQVSHDFVHYKFAGDRVFWTRLAQHGNVAINGRLMNYFLKHKGDVSGNAIKLGIGFFEDMKILNLLYSEKLITNSEYFKAYKKLFKSFWFSKKRLNPNIKIGLEDLLSAPLDSKTSYYKALASVVWVRVKG